MAAQDYKRYKPVNALIFTITSSTVECIFKLISFARQKQEEARGWISGEMIHSSLDVYGLERRWSNVNLHSHGMFEPWHKLAE